MGMGSGLENRAATLVYLSPRTRMPGPCYTPTVAATSLSPTHAPLLADGPLRASLSCGGRSHRGGGIALGDVG